MRSLILTFCLGLLASGCGTLEPTKEIPEDHWTRSPVVVPFAKIGRGLTNVVVSPFDVPATVARMMEERDDASYALVAGTFEGIGNGVVRFCMGVAEILSFPLFYHSEPLYRRRLGQRAIRKEPEVVP